VPGLLSFRELPAVLDALTQLCEPPDLLLCDGQGIAHPRRFGIASHLGLLMDLPSIGVGKTRLYGTGVEPPHQRGAVVTAAGTPRGDRRDSAYPVRGQAAVCFVRPPREPGNGYRLRDGLLHPLSPTGDHSPGTSVSVGLDRRQLGLSARIQQPIGFGEEILLW
jgi:hypothetical protein